MKRFLAEIFWKIKKWWGGVQKVLRGLRWKLETRWQWVRSKKLSRRSVWVGAKRAVKTEFPKVVWHEGMPTEPGEYVVKHGKRTRTAILRWFPGGGKGWIAELGQTLAMKNVVAWRPMPENPMKLYV